MFFHASLGEKRFNRMSLVKVFNSLKLLRELDSVIDFSRSTNQLLLVIYLYSKQEYVSVATISRDLGLSRKNILDSMRKLERKNLVSRLERPGEIYFSLTETGRSYIDKLLSVLSGGKEPVGTAESLKVATRINIGQELPTAYRIYRALIAIGLSRRQCLHVRDLARAMELSVDRAKGYLDAFSASPSKLFRRITMPKGTYYKLTKEGLNILYKTPHYIRYKRSRVYRFFAKAFNTPWPEEIVSKLQKIYLISILTLAILGLFMPVIGFITLISLSSVLAVIEKLVLR